MKNNDFQGFSKETTEFLWELRFNNYKEWFDVNRNRYYEVLREPIVGLANEVAQELTNKTKTEFSVSVSRINRDVRFSKNKEPYRACMWVVFKRSAGSWKDKPVAYFEIGPDYYALGMGIYENLPNYMKAFRNKIDANPSGFERIIKNYDKDKDFQLTGDMYKKFDKSGKSEAVLNWYGRKGISLSFRKDLEEVVYKRELVNLVTDKIMFLMPMLDYMCDISIE